MWAVVEMRLSRGLSPTFFGFGLLLESDPNLTNMLGYNVFKIINTDADISLHHK